MSEKAIMDLHATIIELEAQGRYGLAGGLRRLLAWMLERPPRRTHGRR